jgi:L-histidine N-alpha-methyltransferase
MSLERLMQVQPRFVDATSDARIRHIVTATDDPLAQDAPNVIANLSRSPKRISSVYVYDRDGTELFERQCCTPEYYLRRVETQLLNRYAGDIIGLCGFPPIVELGAGTAEKTRILLAEYEKRAMRCDYFPIDVDADTLSTLARTLVSDYSHIFVHCLGTTYQAGLHALPPSRRSRMFLFLGSSLGNMEWQEIEDLLLQLFGHGKPGDYLLLGADLDKDPAIIDSAYNDSAGYGARSTLNMLHHLNRRYDANFVADNFRYRSHYDSHMKRNEVRIESLVDQTVTLAALHLTVSFHAAELIDAEVMWKFDPEELRSVLCRAGFSMLRRWIDPTYQYGLFLLRHK